MSPRPRITRPGFPCIWPSIRVPREARSGAGLDSDPWAEKLSPVSSVTLPPEDRPPEPRSSRSDPEGSAGSEGLP
jgi:hypothetical protein